MICGFLGVGKTTFSVALAEREKAMRFSLDELYFGLFDDKPTHVLDVAAMDRLSKVVDSLWTEAVRVGASVVLDLGFWERSLRAQTREQAESFGASARLYWVRCSDDVALQRCLIRNGSPGAFLISAEGYRDMRSRFEAPIEEEYPIIVDTNCV